MRVGIFLSTPAQVHFYKNIAKGLEKRGHDVTFLARNYGETIQLLNESGVKFYEFSRSYESKMGKAFQLTLDIYKACGHLRRFKPDVLTGFGIYNALSSGFLRIPSVVFVDSEPRIGPSYSIQFRIFMPFVNAVITPTSFLDDLGPKQVRINSYKELAYLHPDYYKPNGGIFDLLGLRRNEEYALVRFNSFDAVHDLAINGFSLGDKLSLVKMLSEHTNVFVSFEGRVPKGIEEYQLKILKTRIHDVIYYAKLLVTDTQTMATEAAILGTPVIRCNSFVGSREMGNFIELERKYGLIYNIGNPKIALEKARELIHTPGLSEDWKKKRERLLKEKCNITKFIVSFIENIHRANPKNLEDPICHRYETPLH